jgi:hypothetical protein
MKSFFLNTLNRTALKSRSDCEVARFCWNLTVRFTLWSIKKAQAHFRALKLKDHWKVWIRILSMKIFRFLVTLIQHCIEKRSPKITSNILHIFLLKFFYKFIFLAKNQKKQNQVLKSLINRARKVITRAIYLLMVNQVKVKIAWELIVSSYLTISPYHKSELTFFSSKLNIKLF